MPHLRATRSLTLDAAKAMTDAAEAFAVARGWSVAVAVVDAAGGLILFHCLDDTQPASQDVAIAKAKAAARFRRPTKVLEDGIAGGRIAMLSLDALSLEGGVPVTVEGAVLGAIGVSGMQSAQDGEVAQAGLAALRP